MPYTIKQAAEKMNVTAHTLRYYDKEGLLPFVSRDKSGNRIFTEGDLEWLGLISCLKNTGMPIKQTGTYIQWCAAGDASLGARRQMLIEHREAILRQLEELNHNLEAINRKIEYYNKLVGVKVADETIVSQPVAAE